jgi:hypothetical protein
MFELRQVAQNLREVGGAELSGSTRGLDLLRQAHRFLFSKDHSAATLDRSAIEFNVRSFLPSRWTL